jgi:hypothetical protein
MKRIAVILLTLVFATGALAQEKADEFNNVREFRNKVFTVQNRDPRAVFASIRLLGSGWKGAAMNVNEDLRTITVRDFPENLAAVEDALKRLDQPFAEPDMDLKISVLIGSKTPLASPAVPEELAPVVKQLQATLQYSHYGLMTASMHRTKPTIHMEGSGVAEPTLLGMTSVQDRPVMYSYELRSVALDATGPRARIDIGNFKFSMRVPIDVGGAINYQSVGFETPVSIRENEKVVIGTTTMRDKALIVVVTATVQK